MILLFACKQFISAYVLNCERICEGENNKCLHISICGNMFALKTLGYILVGLYIKKII